MRFLGSIVVALTAAVLALVLAAAALAAVVLACDAAVALVVAFCGFESKAVQASRRFPCHEQASCYLSIVWLESWTASWLECGSKMSQPTMALALERHTFLGMLQDEHLAFSISALLLPVCHFQT